MKVILFVLLLIAREGHGAYSDEKCTQCRNIVKEFYVGMEKTAKSIHFR